MRQPLKSGFWQKMQMRAEALLARTTARAFDLKFSRDQALSTNNEVMIIIVHFGDLPKWFNLWCHTAKLNCGIDFYVFQDAVPSSIDGNITYHFMTIRDFNELPLFKANGMRLRAPYKVCDFRPLFAEAFSDILAPYHYWGWGDLDVVYGNVVSVVGDGFGRFDYISTGYNGESGPLAFLRNCPRVNNLWRAIESVKKKVNATKSFALDEIAFVSLLKERCSCDIVFRECLDHLPARWRQGTLVSLSNGEEFALFHFGGRLRPSQSLWINESDSLAGHAHRGGALVIDASYRISVA